MKGLELRGWKRPLTEEARMGGHVSALEHLCHTAKSSDKVLNDLKGCLGVLAENIGETVGVVGIARTHHAALLAIHAAAAATVHTVHAPVHTSAAIH